MKLQTAADIGGQLTRKTIDFSAGVAAGVALARGVITDDLVGQIGILVPAMIAAVGNLAWWNRAQASVVTPEGLEAAGKASTAALVKNAIKAEDTK